MRWKPIVIVVAIAVLLLGTAGTALAWAPIFSSAPYTGNFWLHTTADNQVGAADWIRWSASGVAAMRSDWSPRLDMTADCTADNPGTDQLDYVTFFSNIPNTGVGVWSDCGSLLVREEVDLNISAGSVVAETAYYYQVHYRKRKFGVSGAINLSYQRSNSPTHNWLAKVLYSQ
jgi:hypothetical protein